MENEVQRFGVFLGGARGTVNRELFVCGGDRTVNLYFVNGMCPEVGADALFLDSFDPFALAAPAPGAVAGIHLQLLCVLHYISLSQR